MTMHPSTKAVFDFYKAACEALADPRSGASDQVRDEAVCGVLGMRAALQAHETMLALAEQRAYDHHPTA